MGNSELGNLLKILNKNKPKLTDIPALTRLFVWSVITPATVLIAARSYIVDEAAQSILWPNFGLMDAFGGIPL